MRGRVLIACLLATAMLSCQKAAEQRELYPVRVLLETSATKSAASEGNAITDILLLFVQNGKLATDPVYTSFSNASQSVEVDCGVMEVGTYSIYAYANTAHADWLDSGVQAQEKTWAKGTVFQADRMMKELTESNTPAVPSETMLLTGESTMLVDITDNLGFVELSRPVVRFNVLVYNHANVSASLTSLSFSNFNPSKGYLLPHESLPEGVEYRALPGFTDSVTLSADEGKTVFSTLLYEGSAPSSYTLSATVTMTDPSTSNLLTRSLDNVNLVMVDPDTSMPVPLTSMSRNQDLTVVINIYFQELDGSFTLSVDNTYWTTGHTSEHSFN